MITEEQRLARRTGLFSSDIPRIMAGDAVTVALEKMGKKEEANLDDVVEIQIGNIVEPLILDAYEAQLGVLLMERSLATMRHHEHTWLGAHLDALQNPETNVECKTVGWYMRNEWGEGGDEIPERVIWQTQTQMLVTGCEITHVPVCFINESSLRDILVGRHPQITIFTVHRDWDLMKYIIEYGGEVWQHIQNQTLPAPIKATDVKLVYSKDTGEYIEATDDVFQLYESLLVAKEAKKVATASEEELKTLIQSYMKTAAELRYNSRTLATWRKAKDGFFFDADAFAVDQPEMFKLYLKPTTGSRRFLTKG